MLCAGEAGFTEAAVLLVEFDADVGAAKFGGNGEGGAASSKGIKNDPVLRTTREDAEARNFGREDGIVRSGVRNGRDCPDGAAVAA